MFKMPIVIQAGNNNISLTEFSTVSALFMEDLNTHYGGPKHTTSGFLFLLLNYCQGSWYGHLSNTDTSILRTISNVLTKFSDISLKRTSIIQTRDTKSWPQRVNSHKPNLFITDAVVIR